MTTKIYNNRTFVQLALSAIFVALLFSTGWIIQHDIEPMQQALGWLYYAIVIAMMVFLAFAFDFTLNLCQFVNTTLQWHEFEARRRNG